MLLTLVHFDLSGLSATARDGKPGSVPPAGQPGAAQDAQVRQFVCRTPQGRQCKRHTNVVLLLLLRWHQPVANGGLRAPWERQATAGAGGGAGGGFAKRRPNCCRQLRALLLRSLTWHSRQTKTTICNLLCPSTLLLLILVLQVAVIDPLRVSLADQQAEDKAELLQYVV